MLAWYPDTNGWRNLKTRVLLIYTIGAVGNRNCVRYTVLSSHRITTNSTEFPNICKVIIFCLF